MGLIEIGRDPVTQQIGCHLTNKGKQVFNLNLIERQKEFVRLIISHSAFKQTLKAFLENEEIPNQDIIVEIMKNSKLYNVNSEKTYFRRASTIVGWINWIISQIEE